MVPSSASLSPSTFDVAAHLAGGPTGPPGKYQAAQSAPGQGPHVYEWPAHLQVRKRQRHG